MRGRRRASACRRYHRPRSLKDLELDCAGDRWPRSTSLRRANTFLSPVFYPTIHSTSFFSLSVREGCFFIFYFRCLLFDWIGAQARSTDRPQRPLSAGNLSCFGTSTDFIPDGSTSKLLSTLDSGTQIERRLPNSNSSFLSLWDGEDEKETLMTSSFSFA